MGLSRSPEYTYTDRSARLREIKGIMAEHMSDKAVVAYIEQLVETAHQVSSAQERLDHFKATNSPPIPPVRFYTLDEFIEFHRQRRGYESTLSEHESHLEAAQLDHAYAAEKLGTVLPKNVPLNYAYEGKQRALGGTEYIIENRQGRAMITHSREIGRP